MRRGRIAMVVLILAGLGVEASAGQRANVRIGRKALGERVESLLDRVSRRFAGPGCAVVLSSFKDVDGRPLTKALADSGFEPEAYIDTILYYDGRREGRCANPDVLAVTSPGARVVFVCDEFYRHSWTDSDHAEATLIHEALHTLGLGENPPSPHEITRSVLQHCR